MVNVTVPASIANDDDADDMPPLCVEKCMRLTHLIQSNNFRTLFILLSSSIVYFGTLHVSRISMEAPALFGY